MQSFHTSVTPRSTYGSKIVIGRRDIYRPRLVNLLVIVLVLAQSLVWLPGASAAPPGMTLEVSGPAQVALGAPIELTLTLRHGKNVAGYETVLRFDPTAAEFSGLRQEQPDLIKKLGRDVGSLSAFEVPYGAAIGLYSCPVPDCVSRKGAKQGKGANGTIRLGTAAFAPTQAGVLSIALGPTRVVDASGTVLEVAVVPSTLAIQVGPAGAGPTFLAPASPWQLASPTGAAVPADLTGDGQVTNADAMEVALAWTQLRERGLACWLPGEPLPDPNPDVNRDGCVDVADLQAVVAHYSLAGTTNGPLLKDQPANDLSAVQPQQAEATIIVNSTGDEPDIKKGNGVCATEFGTCTLRAAITEANNRSGANLITFNIPGSGVQTITLTKALPNLFDESGPTTIDGFTQPGAIPNTDPTISTAVILIQVEGAGEEVFPGMAITSAGNLLRGLALYRLNIPIRIYGSGATDNILAGSFVGTNAAGTYGTSAQVLTLSHGVKVEQGARGNRIGGSLPAERNVISGNRGAGVAFWHSTTRNNLVLGNLLGLNPAGTNRLPNQNHGVDLNFGAQSNRIGGTAPGERNVISGNRIMGVDISHNANTSGNEIVGNYIGTSVQGTHATFSHNGHGIQIKDGVSANHIHDNVIGSNQNTGITIRDYYTTNNQVYANRIGVAVDGTAAPNDIGVELTGTSNRIGPDNIIAHNSSQGVLVSARASSGNPSDPTLVRYNTITRNSIYNNGKLGIDLIPSGVTANDPGDVDDGVNEQLNFPVLTSATTSTVSGTACPGCTVEVFIADSGASANGEGKTFIGAAVADSIGAFAASVNGVTAGQVVTTTATDPNGNTSEFSKNLEVTNAAPIAPSNLTANTVSSTQIDLNWTDNATNETAYTVERSTDQSNWAVLTSTLAANTVAYSDTGLAASTTYHFRVKATNGAGSSDYSNIGSATTSDVPPAAPSDLMAIPNSGTQIDLTWTDNASNETAYTVERSTDEVAWTVLTSTLPADTTSYSDTSASPNTTSYYRVKATNNVGSSDYSDTASATTPDAPPTAPSNLVATAISGSQIDLNWIDNSSDEDAFVLERSLDDAFSTATSIVLPANTTSYSDTGLDADAFYYRVKATNAVGDSAYSNTAITATLPAAPSDLTATAISTSQIDLNWTDNATNESAYTVERSTDQVNWTVLSSSLPANTTSYSDTNVSPNTTTYYRVKATNGGGSSAYAYCINFSTATGTTTGVLPGKLEAEDYRLGGQDVGYVDSTSGNTGGACRNDDVDISITADTGGGCNVGWIAPGEWLAYDVSVSVTGSYTFTARVATPSTGKKFHIEVDGVNVTGSVSVPMTGGWQTWTDKITAAVALTAGPHTLKFVAETNGFNLNYITATTQP